MVERESREWCFKNESSVGSPTAEGKSIQAICTAFGHMEVIVDLDKTGNLKYCLVLFPFA